MGQGERGGRESRFFELPFFVPLLSSCASLVAKRVEYNTREVVVCGWLATAPANLNKRKPRLQHFYQQLHFVAGSYRPVVLQ